MTTAQFQSYHIERYYWFQLIASYDALYWAYYSDWTPQPPKRSFGQTGLRTN